MICNNCKNTLPDDSEFCQYCGSKIETPAEAPKIHTIATSDQAPKKNKKVLLWVLLGIIIVALIGAAITIGYVIGKDNNTPSGNNSNPSSNSNTSSNNDISAIADTVGVRTISLSDKATAESIIEEWRKETPPSEEALVKLMDKYGSDQGGGKLHFVEKGMWVEEVEEWCFDSAREVGDYAIIENEYGYTICYFSVSRELKGTLVIALEPDFIPYSWKENGEWQGLHVDIARQIALRNGFTPQFVSASWDELFVGIENGTYNLVLGIEPTEEREEAFANTPVNFTDIYYDGMSAMFNVKEFELSFSDWSEFKFTIKDMVNDGTIADLLATYNLQ